MLPLNLGHCWTNEILGDNLKPTNERKVAGWMPVAVFLMLIFLFILQCWHSASVNFVIYEAHFAPESLPVGVCCCFMKIYLIDMP